MSTFRLDIGVRVSAETPQEAAEMMAAVLAAAQTWSNGAIVPAFIAVRAPEPVAEPEPDGQVAAEPRSVFDRIMGSPSA